MAGTNSVEESQRFQDGLAAESKALENPLAWVDDLILTEDELDNIAEPQWAFPNLIIEGHIILIPAEPNGGKTTIMSHVAGDLIKAGYEVCYVNADIAGTDAKAFHTNAIQRGVKPVIPDMKQGQSVQGVLEKLLSQAKEGVQFHRVVFVFDTLKKILDVLNKAHARELFAALRKLTGRGMTIILLAHTNKHKDAEGNPIFEGTGDMRADVDEMIYFLPVKNPDGSMTVTTKPDKVRGSFEPITFEIDRDRNVRLSEVFVDAQKECLIRNQMEVDTAAIEAIKVAIAEGAHLQKDIVTSCGDVHIGERTVKSALRRYCAGESENQNLPPLWSKERGDKNSYLYSLLS